MEIDFQKIRQKKVKQFLLKFGLTSLQGFARLKPVCYNEALSSSYHKHIQSFLIKKDVATVWKIYTSIPPKEAWKGNMVSFGLQYSRKENSFQYLNTPYSGIEKGQIIVLNLKLLWGLLNIAVAHEVSEVNENQRLIKLCYLEGGASEGSQWISLKETGEGFTEVEHFTLYKSKSSFRDKKLYPPLHTRAITEFHENVRKKATLIIS